VLKSDPDLQGGFASVVPITAGDLMTDGNGEGRIEFALAGEVLYLRLEEAP
jgi:hypothetical protein